MKGKVAACHKLCGSKSNDIGISLKIRHIVMKCIQSMQLPVFTCRLLHLVEKLINRPSNEHEKASERKVK